MQVVAPHPVPSAALPHSRAADHAAADALAELIVMDAPPREPRPGIFRAGAGLSVDLDTAIADLGAASRSVGTLADVTIEGRPTFGAIVSRLRRWGVAVLPGLLAGPLLARLQAEFELFMERQGELSRLFKIDRTPEECCVRVVRDRLDEVAFPTTASFFASPVMEAIADEHLGDAPYVLNHQIFVHRTGPTVRPLSGELHFDVTRMLKFWVYLSEGRAENGAMRAVPGSHLWWRIMRQEYSDRLVPKAEIPNQITETPGAAIPLTGPAGTMFIFDTDVAHGATPVAPGHERRIMRGHCTQTAMISRASKRNESRPAS